MVITEPQAFIEFEKRVKLTHTSFIDAYIPSTKVLVEQKSADAMLTPFQQAKRYANEMPYLSRPRWVVVCNFQSFLIYDMENPNGEPFEILLENLEKEYYRLLFLTDTGNIHLKKEMEISIKAGELVGKIYDALLAQYKDATNPEALRSLNMNRMSYMKRGLTFAISPFSMGCVEQYTFLILVAIYRPAIYFFVEIG